MPTVKRKAEQESKGGSQARDQVASGVTRISCPQEEAGAHATGG